MASSALRGGELSRHEFDRHRFSLESSSATGLEQDWRDAENDPCR